MQLASPATAVSVTGGPWMRSQLLAVRRHLQQRRHLEAAGELGVGDVLEAEAQKLWQLARRHRVRRLRRQRRLARNHERNLYLFDDGVSQQLLAALLGCSKPGGSAHAPRRGRVSGRRSAGSAVGSPAAGSGRAAAAVRRARRDPGLAAGADLLAWHETSAPGEACGNREPRHWSRSWSHSVGAGYRSGRALSGCSCRCTNSLEHVGQVPPRRTATDHPRNPGRFGERLLQRPAGSASIPRGPPCGGLRRGAKRTPQYLGRRHTVTLGPRA